ncbi:hypothetical protein DC498_18385 [Terrimonas sp.]|nr:hypothetical protein DC498_18385 [Terrimonas sp.]
MLRANAVEKTFSHNINIIMIIKYIGAILISACSVGCLQAQIQRGSVLMGGEISDLNWSLSDKGSFSGRLSPKAAFFIKDNIAVGSYISFHATVSEGTSPSTTYGVGILGRYYWGDRNSNLFRKSKFFAEGTVGIEGNNPAEGDNTNGLGLSAGPGIAYFISPAIGLEALAKYKGIAGFWSAPLSHNIVISFGFQIYLTRSSDKYDNR